MLDDSGDGDERRFVREARVVCFPGTVIGPLLVVESVHKHKTGL
jgi:hypothetical protein